MYLWCIDIHFSNIARLCWNCCDLLSKCIFDVLIFTNELHTHLIQWVVICFQNVSLMYWYSLRSVSMARSYQVVICFQNVSLMYWYSLLLLFRLCFYLLWFAFKMYLWCIDIHFVFRGCASLLGCDLLSKCIFDVLIFTLLAASKLYLMVVICFIHLCFVFKGIHATPLCSVVKMYLWCIDIHYWCWN